jgi:hypothetical protein
MKMLTAFFHSQHIDQLRLNYLFHLVLIRHEFQSLSFKIIFPMRKHEKYSFRPIEYLRQEKSNNKNKFPISNSVTLV